MNEAFAGCPDCHATGTGNALYLSNGVVSCPVHGEVTDSQRMAEYRRRGTRFLLGNVPTQTPRASARPME